MLKIEAPMLSPLSDSRGMYVCLCFSIMPNHSFVIERPWLSDIIGYPTLSDIIISSIVQ